jgi:hypothetical protein
MIESQTRARRERSTDTAAILKAYLDSGVIWSRKKPIYGIDTYREKAEAILDAGITAQQVQDYIHYQKTRTDDAFWHDKSVSLEHLLKHVKPWVEAREARHTAALEPQSPAHDRFIAPDRTERGMFYEHSQIMLNDLQNCLDMDRMNLHARQLEITNA